MSNMGDKLWLKPGRRRIKSAIVAVVAVIAAWPLLAWVAALALIKTAGLERADAIVVLSGSAAYVERAQRAAELFHEGRAPLVLLTNDNMRGGWSQERQTNPLFIERARDELLYAGVPVEKVAVLPGAVTGTYDETIAARAYAAQNNLRSVLFVTSAYHTRRTLWTVRSVFRGSAIKAGVEGAKPGGQTPAPGTWWLHRRGWQAVALEYPKLVYYYCHYR